MIRMYRTLLLSCAITTTIHGMKNNPVPKIEITKPTVQFTPSDIQKRPSLTLIESISYVPHNEISPRKPEKILSSSSLIQQTSSGSSIESSPQKTEAKRPSKSFTQSDSSALSKDFSPRKKHHSLKLSQSTSSTSSSRENSPRKEIKHSHTLLTELISSQSDDDSDAEISLLKAVKTNKFNRVQRILNINIPDKEGNTPFIIAAKNGSKKIILELLKQPTLQPNMQNLCKMTALLCAAKEGHRKIVQILVLDPRIDSSITESKNFTILNYLNLDKKGRKIKGELFGRVALDTFIEYEVSELDRLINDNRLTIHLTDQDFNRSTKIVKYNLTTIAERQDKKDRQLPIDAIIPQYATDEFIKQMIKWRLFYRNETTLSPIDQIVLLQQTVTNNSPKNEITLPEHS